MEPNMETVRRLESTFEVLNRTKTVKDYLGEDAMETGDNDEKRLQSIKADCLSLATVTCINFLEKARD